MDYLKISFSNDHYNLALSYSYIYGITKLYEHYKSSGENDKADKLKALALIIAENLGRYANPEYQTNIVEYFNK